MQSKGFLLKKILIGLLWLFFFIGLYIFLKKIIKIDFETWLEPFFDRELLIYLIFLCSEVVIGIIPPEIFMIWALRFEVPVNYILVVFSLAIISYLAGILGYFIGRYLDRTLYYRYIRIRFLRKTDKRLHEYGLFLIIVAAMTPLPFSGVAMLVGSVRYTFSKYLLFSLFRFVRFGLYAWVFWEVRIVV